MRRRLRSLIGLIEIDGKEPLYTNFADELGELRELDAAALFIRSLVGLDRIAAKELFADFFAEGTHTANQIR
ncbi:hypothetical protein NZK33_04475 [Cyanobium sp. FGCU-6]|nr:hypothetical protein [Cyanobium sp. FGCU6]